MLHRFEGCSTRMQERSLLGIPQPAIASTIQGAERTNSRLVLAASIQHAASLFCGFWVWGGFSRPNEATVSHPAIGCGCIFAPKILEISIVSCSS